MSQQLDALQAAVTANTAVVDSVVTRIAGLAQQIADLKDDPVALQALSDALLANNQKLADAVAANTPGNG